MIPNLDRLMNYVVTPVASRLTGLSVDLLREWAVRRALIPADGQPCRKGAPAQYSWQTILVLRLATTLHRQFRIELQGHKDLFDSWRQTLKRTSFIALSGRRIAFYGNDRWELLGPGEIPGDGEDVLIFGLDQHLEVLREGFGLPSPTRREGQLELFPVRAVRDAAVASAPSPTAKAVGR
ncbi:hypothetical protein SKA58_11920 [Sphingomonas sp. SKA58]|uniref:hypothetical protein n=2 Tax=Sphingomonadaceae TaxID=41297 RepID=UPI0000D7A70C|nr:hypothetical protein [Sphingomonas sp. SKA58]EAT07196.1 hypothetical protein SKA58_11920 [Sphingomonas sp. SKA58]